MKKLIALIMVAIAVASTLPMIGLKLEIAPEVQAATPTVKVVSAYNMTQAEVNTTFLVAINVTDVTDLNLWYINFSFDPQHVKITTGNRGGIQYPRRTGVYYNILEGSFLKNVSGTAYLIKSSGLVNNTSGIVNGIVCSLSGASRSGSGTLLTINFTLLKEDISQLNVTGSLLQTPSLAAIDHNVANGVISKELPPVPPIWVEPWFQSVIVGAVVIGAAAAVYKKFGKKIREKRILKAREIEPVYEEKEPKISR